MIKEEYRVFPFMIAWTLYTFRRQFI